MFKKHIHCFNASKLWNLLKLSNDWILTSIGTHAVEVTLTALAWRMGRLVYKGGVISYQKSEFSLKIDILLHNWASKWIYSIRYEACLYFLFRMPWKHLYLRPQNDRRSPPPKAADFVGRFFVFCTDVSWASKTKNIDKHHIWCNIFILKPNCVIKYRFSRKNRIFDNLSLHLRPRSALTALAWRMGEHSSRFCGRSWEGALCQEGRMYLRRTKLRTWGKWSAS